MGHIGYEFISGLIQDLHPCQHLVKCICDQLCLCIIRNGYLIILISVCQIIYRLGDPRKRFYKNSGKYITKQNGQCYYEPDDQDLPLLQLINGRSDLIG